MPAFHYQEIFEPGADTTAYRALGAEGLTVEAAGGPTHPARRPRRAAPSRRRGGARRLPPLPHRAPGAAAGHPRRPGGLGQRPLRRPGDAAQRGGVGRDGPALPARTPAPPSCFAHKGEDVYTGGGDEEALSHGIFDAYTGGYLRYSQLAPLTMFEERNTGTNLPAQIEIHAVPGGRVRVPVRHQGRRVGQQDAALPGVEGPAQPGGAAPLPRGEAALAGHRRLPARTTWPWSSAAPRPRPPSRRSSWPPAATSTACPPPATSTAGPSATWRWSRWSSNWPGRPASGPSSAASTSASTPG